VSHRNAPLSELGRLRLARCVVEDRWPLRRAAERFQGSATTAARWAGRYRLHGVAGMIDRSSRPRHSPARTPTRTERRIIKVRVLRRWGPARIGYLLGLHPSTVHRVLTRYRLAKLRWLDRPTGRVVRRMHSEHCGDLVHVDVKKLGKIPPLANTTPRPTSPAGSATTTAIPCAAITSCTPPSTHTRGWRTPSSSAPNAKRLPRLSGPGPTRGSQSVGSPFEKC
jgi:hypothetical protein